MKPSSQRIGVISDTHGLLRPEAVRALRGADLILHAGDVGRPEILDELGRLAPVVAVRGNVDRDEGLRGLPPTEMVEVGGFLLYLIHTLEDLDLDPAAAGFAAVVYGHSHRPSITRKNGVLYLNPGSAGPRRFDLPLSVAEILVDAQGLSAHLIRLRVRAGD